MGTLFLLPEEEGKDGKDAGDLWRLPRRKPGIFQGRDLVDKLLRTCRGAPWW